MRKQIALCIGNDDYQYSCLPKLQCAENDCRAIAEKLNQLCFDVMVYNNLDRVSMHEVIDKFEHELPNYDVALFYYAGHGFESDGSNLLMPVDTDGTDKGYRDWMALKLDYIIDALEGKHEENQVKTKIIILDACRQNPDGRGSNTNGFAPVFAPAGTIIAFSTSPGQNAIEFNGHGAYTCALLQSIDIPRIPIENMFKHVREILSASTAGKQISWEHTSLMGNYCFNEDRIDAFSFYSADALADENYYLRLDNPFQSVTEQLKSHDFYSQNPAVSRIYSLPFENASVNDLFVLGRNIYQAAEGGAWSAQGLINNFLAISIPMDAKVHILCGMSYEIYYDKKGLIRNNFKSGYYAEIIRLLETEQFQMSQNFILSQLYQEPSQLVYYPASESKIELHLITEESYTNENGDVFFFVRSVYYHGQNVLFSKDGTEDIPEDDYFYSSAYNFAALKTELAKRLVAPQDMLVLTVDNDHKSNYYYSMPLTYSLRKTKVVK